MVSRWRPMLWMHDDDRAMPCSSPRRSAADVWSERSEEDSIFDFRDALLAPTGPISELTLGATRFAVLGAGCFVLSAL